MEEKARSQLPGFAWPVVVIGSLAILIGIFFISRPSHRHGTEGRYTGPEACRQCHAEQFESWAHTRMAKTFEVLRPGEAIEAKKIAGLDPETDYTTDADCVRCHTTGYGKVGGFVSIEETPHMAGVTCEACHGAGGGYAGTVMSRDNPTFATSEAAAAGLVYPPTEAVCATCHNDDSPFVGMEYEFDFSARVSRGTHQHFELKYAHDG